MNEELEEQLERIRRLTERLNDMRRSMVENSELIARDHRVRHHDDAFGRASGGESHFDADEFSGRRRRG